MRGKSRSKLQFERRPEGESSGWEIILFALIFVTIVFMLGTVARAEELAPGAAQARAGLLNSRTKIGSLAQKKPTETFSFSGALTLDTTRTLDSDQETDFGGNLILTPNLTYNPENISASLLMIYSREYVFERKDGSSGDFEDFLYSLKKTWKSGADFRTPIVDEVSVGLTGGIPVKRESRDRTFRGSVGPRIWLKKKAGRFTFATRAGYEHRFYQTEMDPTGKHNNEHLYLLGGAIVYNFTEKFSFALSGDYFYFVDYENFDSGSQMASLGFNWQFLEKVGASLGIATNRSTIDPSGQTEMFKFYEKESSLAFIDLIFKI